MARWKHLLDFASDFNFLKLQFLGMTTNNLNSHFTNSWILLTVNTAEIGLGCRNYPKQYFNINNGYNLYSSMFLYFQRNKDISLERTWFKVVDRILNLLTTLSFTGAMYIHKTLDWPNTNVHLHNTKKVFWNQKTDQSGQYWIYHYV